MNIETEANIMAFVVMAFVIALKTYGFYMMKKMSDPEIHHMAPQYIITGVFGLLTAFAAYQVISTDIFEVFKTASVYAIAFNLLFDVPSKFSKG